MVISLLFDKKFLKMDHLVDRLVKLACYSGIMLLTISLYFPIINLQIFLVNLSYVLTAWRYFYDSVK